MLTYFIQIWSIDMNALSKSSALKCNSYVSMIKDIFRQTSLQITDNPQIMIEIISFQAQGLNSKPHTISIAEKWLYFPEVEEVENIDAMGLESILPPLITKAIQTGELDKSTDSELLFLTLSSLFFGTALLLLKNSTEAYPIYLQAQVNQLFKGLSC